MSHSRTDALVAPIEQRQVGASMAVSLVWSRIVTMVTEMLMFPGLGFVKQVPECSTVVAVGGTPTGSEPAEELSLE